MPQILSFLLFWGTVGAGLTFFTFFSGLQGAFFITFGPYVHTCLLGGCSFIRQVRVNALSMPIRVSVIPDFKNHKKIYLRYWLSNDFDMSVMENTMYCKGLLTIQKISSKLVKKKKKIQ